MKWKRMLARPIRGDPTLPAVATRSLSAGRRSVSQVSCLAHSSTFQR